MKIAKPTIKSQVAAMDGHIVVKAPESAIAQFVNGDIKGGESAHNYRMTVVESAIREAYKGNSRALIEARTFAEGKGKKAKAYAAGFDAVGIPSRVQYVGKLDSEANEEARAAIASGVAASAFDFEAAFLTVMAVKPAARVKKTDPAPVVVTEATVAPEPTVAPEQEVTVAELDVSDVMLAATNAISGGIASADEVAAIRAALALYDAASASAADWVETVADEAMA